MKLRPSLSSPPPVGGVGGGGLPFSQLCFYRPIFGWHEGFDLSLSLDDQPHSHRLYPTGGKPAPAHFVAQERAERVTNEAIEDAPRLLRLYPLHVNLAWVGKGVSYGIACDLVELDAMHWPPPNGRLKRLDQVPGYGLPFAVRVGRQVDLG